MTAGHPVALVTGAARRLGAAIARRLHAAGYDLALHFHGSVAEAAALAAELEAARAGSVLRLQADLAAFDRLPELVAHTVGRFGRLDALVNNASEFAPEAFGGIHPAHWDRMMAVNARAPFFLAQAAAPHLRATRGAVVNLSDVYASAPRADLAAYASSKGALEAATRALAVAMAPEVRVNAVAPGAILWPEDGIDPALRERLLAMTPLGRTGTPAEVAAAVLWLLRDATYTTGTVLAVDGGRGPG
ncbi:MAG: pteridine reductase [Gammaproteobacteria bacterium]|nr:pteridine reductase [Gammaproteobacteria bacterium]